MFMGFGLIFIVLILAAIVYFLGGWPQAQNRPFSRTSSSRSALDIAKERYARGEISKEEYEQIRHDLIS